MPSRFVDISGTLEKKMTALEAYKAEIRPAPHSRSFEGIRTLAAHRGFSVGLPAAEAFMSVRELL
jgi:LmbE family N-acetylglucosaminyl deacetylase